MIKTIYLAGGCFWGLQKLMNSMGGVVHTAAGYANGTSQSDAVYEKVCRGDTGFRETVRVDYDDGETRLNTLLAAFFAVIDPEAINRQGNDVGTQYQAGIYYGEDAEQDVLNMVGIQASRYENFAVEVKPLENFFDAEEYHQNYLDKNPGGYCHIPSNIIDDFAKQKTHPGLYVRPDDDYIRENLSGEQYRVTQQNGTEPAFSNPFWDSDEKGIFEGGSMKQLKLKADAPFHNNVDVAVIDFPDGAEGRERQRCKVTIEFAESDVNTLKSRGLDFDAAMEYYRDWLYNVVKVNLSSDWQCAEGYDEVMSIIADHVKLYY